MTRNKWKSHNAACPCIDTGQKDKNFPQAKEECPPYSQGAANASFSMAKVASGQFLCQLLGRLPVQHEDTKLHAAKIHSSPQKVLPVARGLQKLVVGQLDAVDRLHSIHQHGLGPQERQCPLDLAPWKLVVDGRLQGVDELLWQAVHLSIRPNFPSSFNQMGDLTSSESLAVRAGPPSRRRVRLLSFIVSLQNFGLSDLVSQNAWFFSSSQVGLG